MRCPKCARDNPDDAKFCIGCGNPFGSRCTKCDAENPGDASFCKQCGTRLGRFAAPPAASARSERLRVGAEQADSAALDGERKTVTALFADIKGSMELDWPYATGAIAEMFISMYEGFSLSESQRAAIDRSNAEALFLRPRGGLS